MGNQGNMLMVWIIVVVVMVGGLGYLLIKYRRYSVLNRAIKEKNYELIIELSEQPSYRKALGNLSCDLYKFNAFRSMGRIDDLKQSIDNAIQLYGGKDLEKILELYFHYILHHNDAEYAKKLLADIRDTGNAPFVQCCEWCYQVVAEHRNDLANEMEDQVNANVFSGYNLGIVLYLIAFQLQNEGDLKEALEYYKTAMQCFVPHAIYMELSSRNVEMIENKLNEADNFVD